MFLDGTTNAKNVSSSSSGVKHKTVINVSMLEFVKLVRRIAVDVTIRQRIVDDTIIAQYIKELKTSDSGSGASGSTKAVTTN